MNERNANECVEMNECVERAPRPLVCGNDGLKRARTPASEQTFRRATVAARGGSLGRRGSRRRRRSVQIAIAIPQLSRDIGRGRRPWHVYEIEKVCAHVGLRRVASG